LHGIVNLPNSFDYKTFMAAELLKKHVLSICNIAYILRKLSPDIDIPTVLTDLSALTTLTPIDNLVISAALKSTCKDFEDALQHFSALQYNGMTHIPTRNPSDFILSKIPVFTPKKYLESKKH